MRSVKSEWKQTWGGGTTNVTLCSLCEKIAWFFKQQIEFFLISNLANAKFSLLKEHRHFIKLFIWLVNILLLSYIYLCKKHCHLLYWVSKKNSYFLSFHYPVLISILQLFLRGGWGNSQKQTYVEGRGGLHKKWKGMDIRGFEWAYFLNDLKVFLLQLRSMIC